MDKKLVLFVSPSVILIVVSVFQHLQGFLPVTRRLTAEEVPWVSFFIFIIFLLVHNYSLPQNKDGAS